MCPGLAALSTSCLERAKQLKTRLGILLHKPDLGHKSESFTRSEQSAKQRNASEDIREWGKSFDHLLKSKNGVATFHAFLKTEFSEENLEFWLACEVFKKSRSKSNLSSKAHRIFKEFVQKEAPKEVNIDHETREITQKNLAAPTSSCFSAAQAKTHTLMEKDSYPRFLKSATYRNLMEQATSCSTNKRLHT